MLYPKHSPNSSGNTEKDGSQHLYNTLTGLGVFSLTCNNPRCNKASIQFINSIKRHGGIIIEHKTVRTYTKCDTPVPSTLFSFDGKRSSYGNLADIYQQLVQEVHTRIYQQLPPETSLHDMSITDQTSFIEKMNKKGRMYVQQIELKNGFVCILLDDNAPSMEEGVTYKLYLKDDLMRTKNTFPTWTWKQEHLDNMFHVAQKEMSF